MKSLSQRSSVSKQSKQFLAIMGHCFSQAGRGNYKAKSSSKRKNKKDNSDVSLNPNGTKHNAHDNLLNGPLSDEKDAEIEVPTEYDLLDTEHSVSYLVSSSSSQTDNSSQEHTEHQMMVLLNYFKHKQSYLQSSHQQQSQQQQRGSIKQTKPQTPSTTNRNSNSKSDSNSESKSNTNSSDINTNDNNNTNTSKINDNSENNDNNENNGNNENNIINENSSAVNNNNKNENNGNKPNENYYNNLMVYESHGLEIEPCS